MSRESPVGPPLLRLEDLALDVALGGGVWAPAVDRVSLQIGRGERVALVGESGSGKSLTAMAALGLLPPRVRRRGGRVEVEGLDLDHASAAQLRSLRGGTVALIPQEPASALNPVYSVSFHLRETLRIHRGLAGRRAVSEAVRLLTEVGLESPEQLLGAYPHQLSGGQNQRVLLAVALSCEPRLLIADEPTTDLDVTSRAQVLRRLVRVSEDRGLALLLITHDLAAVAAAVHRVAVMYAGEIVELAPTRDLFATPAHPYTTGLLGCLPRLGASELPLPLPGGVPEPGAWGTGCRFAPRCPRVRTECTDTHPELIDLPGDRASRCPWSRAEDGQP